MYKDSTPQVCLFAFTFNALQTSLNLPRLFSNRVEGTVAHNQRILGN